MTLDEALKFTSNKIRQGFVSDGCTYAPDMGIRKFCRMHDALLTFKPVSRAEADKLLFEGILSKGKRYLPIAVIYWTAVRLYAIFH